MNALPTLRNVIARMDSAKLRSLRWRIECKLVEELKAGPIPQERARSFVREVDVITACSEELFSRPFCGRSEKEVYGWGAVDHETVLGDPNTLMRLPFFIKVF